MHVGSGKVLCGLRNTRLKAVTPAAVRRQCPARDRHTPHTEPQLQQLQCVGLHAVELRHRRLSCAAAPSDQPAAAVAAPGQSPAAEAVTPVSAVAAAAAQLPTCQPLDILKVVTADGSEVFLEVVSSSSSNSSNSAPQQQVIVAYEGVTYELQPSNTPSTTTTTSSSSSSSDSSSSSSSSSDQLSHLPWVLQPQGWVLQPTSDLVKALPGWSAAVQQQQARQKLPQQPLLLQSVEKVYSAAALQAAVQQNPGPWRDGTGPSDPPVKGLQYQTLCAGEIEALLAGQRGVVMVQLWVGWDAAAPQPVHNCLVVHGLQRALARKDVSIFMSSAAGGLGLTAILAAQVEPYRSWGKHMASFGGQAALVADSAFYKLLIGRILGYAEPNIKHHILATTGRPVAPQVAAAVEKELTALSRQKPRLPWKAGPAAAVGRTGGSSAKQQQQQQKPAEQQGKQQLSRSARKKTKS